MPIGFVPAFSFWLAVPKDQLRDHPQWHWYNDGASIIAPINAALGLERAFYGYA